MPYVEPQDVREVLAPDGSVSPGNSTAASMSDDELEAQIVKAQSQVDASLASGPTFYTTPFPDGSVPNLVQEITADIAAYLATLTWQRGSLVADSTVALRYARAKELLDQLASGALLVPGYGPAPGGEAYVVNVVPDEWTWWPDLGFGNGQQVPG